MFKGIIEDEGYDSSAPNVRCYLSRIDDIAQAARAKYCHQLDNNYLWKLQISDPDIVYKTVFESIMKLVGIEFETVTHYVIKEKDNED